MNQYETERRLCWCYGLLATFLSITVICIAVPYNHWRSTLDQCDSNIRQYGCGCIFYGVSGAVYFSGGHPAYCLYAIFAPLPLVAFALIMALFHMYRVCINNIGKYEDDKTTTMEEIEGESIIVTTRTRVSNKNDGVVYCWIPTACIAAVFAIYNMAHAILITDGFIKTCAEYRHDLAKGVFAAGDHVTVIHFRLSCQAIYDFMDYLVKDKADSRRGDFINTGAALQIAIFMSWISVILWIAVAVYSSVRAYKERDVLTFCGNL